MTKPNIKDFYKFIKLSRERTVGVLVYYVYPLNTTFCLGNSTYCRHEIIYDPVTDKIYFERLRLTRKEKMILKRLLFT